MKDGLNTNYIRIKEKNINFFNYNHFIFLIKIISLVLWLNITDERNLIYFSSEIHLTVTQSGNQNIISNSFYLDPSRVLVNGENINSCKACDLQIGDNVTIYFDVPVNSCYSMFSELNNIKKIDLSKFDFSSSTTLSFMFYNCFNLEKIHFGNINTSSIREMKAVFYACIKLISLDLSLFDTSSVTIMSSMFQNCSSLTLIDISNFDTSKVNEMNTLFYDCIKLKTIILGNMNTSSLTSMSAFFYNCNNLESINLTSFNTSSVTSMEWMFAKCYALKSIIFSENFITANVTTMGYMFLSCHSLVSLDLSTFDISKVTDIKEMFNNCKNLKYLDIPHFSSSNITSILYTFRNLSSLIYLNINSLEINDNTETEESFDLINPNVIICSNESRMKNYLSSNNLTKNLINNCSDICFKKNIKLDIVNNECIFECKNNGYNYSYNNICYKECPNGTICNEEGNIQEIYFEESEYNIEYNSEYNIEYNSEYNNVYNRILSTSFSIDNQDTTLNEITDTIHNFRDIIVSTSLNYQKSLTNNIQYYNKYDSTLKIVEITRNNEDIFQELINNVINNYDISKGEEIIYQGDDNHVFHITNSRNEMDLLEGKKNNTSNKFSIIDLGQCGNILKNHYKINQNTSLIIMKFEKVTNITLERSLQYEVYEPINKTKLNLSICSNVSIDIYIPLVLSEKTQNLYNELKNLGYDLFDIESPFYQDICTPYKSSNNTDVLLSDRINYYYNNEETTCQSNCKFSNYLMESQYLKCDCDITNSNIETSNSQKFNPKSIYQSFYDVLKYSNYKVLKCIKLSFSLNSIISNIGSIIIIVFFVIYSLFFIFFCLKGIKLLKEDFNTLYNKTKEIKKNNIVKTNKIIELDNKYKEKINEDIDSDEKINNSKSFKGLNNKKDKLLNNTGQYDLLSRRKIYKRQNIKIFENVYPPKKTLLNINRRFLIIKIINVIIQFLFPIKKKQLIK